MKVSAFVAAAAGALLGCSDVSAPPEAASSSLSAWQAPEASSARRAAVSGDFAANVDFTTLTLTPRGQNCLLRVRGQLVFSGTITGTTDGETSALVFATCEEVATTPPGTFRDVFHSPFTFDGTVDGKAVTARGIYMGGVEPGGHIEGTIVFSQGLSGVLRTDATVAVGGSYEGSVVVH